jgi:hypothetical protein
MIKAMRSSTLHMSNRSEMLRCHFFVVDAAARSSGKVFLPLWFRPGEAPYPLGNVLEAIKVLVKYFEETHFHRPFGYLIKIAS